MNLSSNTAWSDLVAANVDVWTGIKPPPATGRVMAQGLLDAARGFEQTRGLLGFEQEPSDFIAALRDVMRKD